MAAFQLPPQMAAMLKGQRFWLGLAQPTRLRVDLNEQN